MLRSDENRERIAYTCIMYMYMYIIIFLTYIYIFISRILLLKFISSFFSFLETTGCRRTSRKAVKDARRVFSFSSFFFLFLHGIKGRFPPLHGPRIYLILVLFFNFFSFFSFLLLLLLARTGASRKSRDARARVHDSNYAFFFPFSLSLSLSLLHSIFRYSLTIVITIRLDCWCYHRFAPSLIVSQTYD